MNETRRRQRIAFAVTLVLLVLATAALAGQKVTNRAVAKRMIAMGEARTSIDTLADMMSSRIYYDKRRAKAAPDACACSGKECAEELVYEHRAALPSGGAF